MDMGPETHDNSDSPADDSPGSGAPTYAAKYMVPCDHWIGKEERECGVTPTKRFIPGHRCQDHQPSRLAGHPDPPKPPKRDLPPLPQAPASASRITDQRAIASGKRRSSNAAYREAKKAVGRGTPKRG